MQRFEAVVLVERERRSVGFGDRKREAGHFVLDKSSGAVLEQCAAKAAALRTWTDAELRDVTDIVANARAEDEALELEGACVAQDPGVFYVKGAAAGEADDVVQKSLRAVKGAVLVVDAGVHVAGVGAMDQVCG